MPLPLFKPLRVVQFGQKVGPVFSPVRPRVLEGLSSSVKSLVQLGNTFITQSSCGCLKKCLQLSILLPLPSHKFHTYPKIHKKKALGCPRKTQMSTSKILHKFLWSPSYFEPISRTTLSKIPQHGGIGNAIVFGLDQYCFLDKI